MTIDRAQHPSASAVPGGRRPGSPGRPHPVARGCPAVMVDGFRERLRPAARGLTPGYFALVMASGIISVGMQLEGRTTLSALLLLVCAAAFVVLLALTAWRLVAYWDAVVDDFTDPRRAFGFFTFI